MTDIDEYQNYDEYTIEDDNVIALSENEIKNMENIFKNTMKEKKEQNNIGGFIDRLNHSQKEAFDKIIDPDNKNIILLGKAGTGNY